MKILLPINWTTDPAGWRLVDAEIVDVAPHVAMFATFAVHKFPEPLFGKWAVTNVETGLRVSLRETKKEATARAVELLSAKSAQQVMAAINKSKGKPKP